MSRPPRDKFKTIYPIFNRRVDFFQVRRDQGEGAEDFWQRLSKLGDVADLGSMTREDLTSFRYIDACDDKCLREKIFCLKRKDATSIKEVIAQYKRQQKAEAALRSKTSSIQSTPSTRCSSCGAKHLQCDCGVFINKVMSNYCGGAGHIAKVCWSKHGKPRTARPVRAVTDAESEPNTWVNRLKLHVSHKIGSFNFPAFPDTGSAATLIAADLAHRL